MKFETEGNSSDNIEFVTNHMEFNQFITITIADVIYPLYIIIFQYWKLYY